VSVQPRADAVVPPIDRRGDVPRIAFAALGGTISSTNAVAGGVVPSLTAEDLLEVLPNVSSVADVVVVERATAPIPGPHLTLELIVELAHDIAEAFADGAVGCVVTQGTDTLEETAFALDLLLPADLPVVMTGAMRNPTLPGADGSANLLSALRAATDQSAHGLGVLVVLGDDIHAARYVRKMHTTRPAAFESPLVGPVGTVLEDRVVIRSRPVPVGPRGLLPMLQRVPPVALLRAAIGDDGRMIDAVGRYGYEGLVFEGFGGGHAAPVVADRLEAVASTMPVVITSRVGTGALLRETYGFVGSERDLARRGLLFCDDIDGVKARIMLTFLLGAGLTGDALRSWYASSDGQRAD
jgi:L-asparaginase